MRRATPGKVVWARQVLYVKRAKRLRTRIATITESAQTRYLGRDDLQTLPHHLGMVADAPGGLADATRATSLSPPHREGGPFPRPAPRPSNASNRGPPVAPPWRYRPAKHIKYMEHARPRPDPATTSRGVRTLCCHCRTYQLSRAEGCIAVTLTAGGHGGILSYRSAAYVLVYRGEARSRARGTHTRVAA